MKTAHVGLVVLGGGLLFWLCAYPRKAGALTPAVHAALSRDIVQAPTLISTHSTAQDVRDFVRYFTSKGYVVRESDAVYGPGGRLRSFAFRAAYPGAPGSVEARVKPIRWGIGSFTREGSTTSVGIAEYKTPVSRL